MTPESYSVIGAGLAEACLSLLKKYQNKGGEEELILLKIQPAFTRPLFSIFRQL